MKNLVFLDTETTSLEEGRLVQLCVKGPEPDELINELFKPPVPIEYEAMAVHHMTEKMVADKPPFVDALLEQVADPLTKNIVVAHNAAFDIEVMRREGVEIKEWICTKKVAMHLWPKWDSHKLQYLRYRLGIEIEAGNAHDAMADVIVLEAVFEKLIAEACKILADKEMQDAAGVTTRELVIQKMIDWSTQPSMLHAFNFGKFKGKTYEEVARVKPDYLDWIVKQVEIDEDVRYTASHWLKQLPKQSGIILPRTSLITPK